MSGKPRGDGQMGSIFEKPLVIPTDHCFIHFKSDPSGCEKGFSMTITAPVSEAAVERLCHACVDALSDAGLLTRLEIARRALKTCSNDFEQARIFIQSNAEKLREEATHHEEASQSAVGGVYRHRLSRFTANLQLGDVAQDGAQLVPVPRNVRGHEEYGKCLGKKLRWCNIKSEEPGVGVWIEVITPEARYDVMLHEQFRPVTKETTAAMRETAILCDRIVEKDNIQLETREATARKTQAAVRKCISAALSPLNDPERASMVSRLGLREADVPRFAMGVIAGGCDSVELLRVIDDEALLPILSALDPPLPPPLDSSRLHRQLLAHLMQTAAVEFLREATKEKSQRRHDAVRTNSRGNGDRCNLGGWDTLAATNALRQDKEGRICWLGRWFKPIKSKELPSDGPRGWLTTAFKPLLEHELKKNESNQEPLLFLLENEEGKEEEPGRAPLLMFQGALGDPSIVSRHPGTFWEVYCHPARAFFSIDALSLHGARMHRTSVFTSDQRHAFVQLDRNASMDDLEGPLADHMRYAGGYMFRPLLQDTDPVTSQVPQPTLTMRRTPGEHASAADRRAMERAGLTPNGVDEWGAQELVPSEVLRPLLPHVLVESFEFWASGPSLIWGYRRTDDHLDREERIEKAQKKGDDAMAKATQRQWYDGWALYIKLIPIGSMTSAVVHRIAWDGMSGLSELASIVDPYRLPSRVRADPAKQNLVPSTEEPLTLLNPEDASICRGGLLEGILASLTRLVNVGNILIWSRSRPTKPGELCEVSLVEIPLLKLKFRPEARVGDDGVSTTRLYSLDFAGLFVAEDDLSAHARTHVPDLRNFIWLSDNQSNHFLLLPNVQSRRFKVRSLALNTEMVPDWSSLGNVRCAGQIERPYFLYPLHPSQSYLTCSSVASALFLALQRAHTRHFHTITSLLPLCFTDTPYKKDEEGIFRELFNECSEDMHPDAIAISALLWCVLISQSLRAMLTRITRPAQVNVFGEQVLNMQSPPGTQNVQDVFAGRRGRFSRLPIDGAGRARDLQAPGQQLAQGVSQCDDGCTGFWRGENEDSSAAEEEARRTNSDQRNRR